MDLTPLTIGLALLSLLQIVWTWRRLLVGRIGARAALFTGCVWLAVLFVALFPDSLNWLAEIAGLGNRLFFALAIALIFVIQMIFAMVAQMERFKQTLDRQTQEIAILNYTIAAQAREQAPKN